MRDSRIDAIKYYCIIGMVLLHSSYLLDGISGNIPVQMIVNNIAGIGLPLFFFLSAYFFAKGYSTENMEHKIISRIKKIAIPYLLWHFIIIKIYTILGRLSQNSAGIRFIDETYFPPNVREMLRFIYHGWRDPPLWYSLVLMQFVFITPVLFVLVKRFKYISLVAIGMLVLINLVYYGGISYASISYWCPEYLAGIWTAVYAPSIVDPGNGESWDRSKKWISVDAFIFFWVISCILLMIDKQTIYNYFKYVGWVLAPLFLLGISYLIPKKEFLYKGQFDAEYIIFCLHYPLTHMIATMAGNFIRPVGNKQMILFWIGVVSATLFCCHIVHYILKYQCRPIYRLLYGDY